MKKSIFYFTLMILSLSSYAQSKSIYTRVTKYDKFDDIEWTKEIKTIITQTDTTFVFETKGSKPETYTYVDNPFWVMHSGSRDSLVNLVANVWGYESQYVAMSEQLKEELAAEAADMIKDLPDSLDEVDINLRVGLLVWSKLDKLPKITVRKISRYSHRYEYDGEYIWIKFEDGSRIIYSKN